ncbi:hypothetical protein EDC04DRAFT_2917868 [Pisolithus marmoratus]|nr:hypothetical protein EDC04DRAFT_2917868 [Pisolithus marmoratus]
MPATRSRGRPTVGADAPITTSAASHHDLPTSPPLSPAPSDNENLPRSRTASSSPDPCSNPVPTSPMDIALLYSVENICTTLKSISDDLAVENNPRPLRNVMRNSAEYWVANDGNLWHLKFIAKLDTTGHFTKMGPYFNLQTGGIDLAALQKARAQIELRPLDENDTTYPAEAIRSSRIAIDTLLAMCSEVEQVRNAKIPAENRPSVTPFLKSHLYNDSFSIVVHTEPLFRGLPNPQSAETPIMARANIGQSNALMSPSKAKAHAIATTQPSHRPKKPAGSRIWQFDDMPDPESRYASLKNSHDLKDVTVQSPDVFDTNGVFIHAAEYNTKLHDGQVMEVDVILRLWTFKPGLKDVNGSCIYQVMLQGMKLMPYAEYVKNNLVRRALPQTPDCKGKRKASESPCNQSPSKKTMTLSEVEDVANMQVDEM